MRLRTAWRIFRDPVHEHTTILLSRAGADGDVLRGCNP